MKQDELHEPVRNSIGFNQRMNPQVRFDRGQISPSPFVRRFGPQIVAVANPKPILDVACGGGRNAVFIAHLGGTVICIDRDLARFEAERVRLADSIFAPSFSRITTLRLDLIREPWPFPPDSVGGIVNVHFQRAVLSSYIIESLSSGGCLLLETVQARGGNYLELPKAETLRLAFGKFFDLKTYRERKAGPVGNDAVTVQMFGVRHEH